MPSGVLDQGDLDGSEEWVEGEPVWRRKQKSKDCQSANLSCFPVTV